MIYQHKVYKLMTDPKTLKNPSDMAFEEALRELESVVQGLEDGRIPLEDAIASYERGAALKKRCDDLLQKARLKVKEVYESRDQGLELKASDLNDIVDQG